MIPFSISRKPLPQPCGCGQSDAPHCDEVGLRNHRNFPPFAHLGYEDDVDEDYYALDNSGFRYSPVRHWAFVGEIVQDLTDFIRPRLLVKTHFGELTLVNFHLEGSSVPTFCAWSDLKVGNSLCLLYAKKRTFLDMKEGIRQENPDGMMIFPCSLEGLTAEVARLTGTKNTPQRKCFVCSTEESGDKKLLKCSRCKEAVYCSRECQSTHWKQSHKKLCCHAQKLKGLVNIDFSHFENFYDWNLSSKPPMTDDEAEKQGKRVIRDFMHRHGVEPTDLMEDRLKAFLATIKNKDIFTDPISKQLLRTEGLSYINAMRCHNANPMTALSVEDTFLYKSLVQFAKNLKNTKNSNNKFHVVDLKRNDRFEEMQKDAILNVLFLSIPQWQHEECIRGISWVFEAHQVMSNEEAFCTISDSKWSIKQDSKTGIGGLFAKNHASGVQVFCVDDMSVADGVSQQIATQNPHDLVVRVLRATANESYQDSIRQIVSTPTPPNLYTLWIREDDTLCGTFHHPLRPDMDLLEQLLDTRPANMIELLRSQNERDDSSSEEATNKKKCADCRIYKTKNAFSKTQLRKRRGTSRCNRCIQTNK